jgi:hypothetical protein
LYLPVALCLNPQGGKVLKFGKKHPIKRPFDCFHKRERFLDINIFQRQKSAGDYESVVFYAAPHVKGASAAA